jgi:hypothetical protein
MMLRKVYAENGMVSDGWVSVDPADSELIEAVYKKTLREGEERLMLAVLENAVNISRSTSLHGNQVASSYFKKPRNGFWIKKTRHCTRLKTSVTISLSSNRRSSSS